MTRIATLLLALWVMTAPNSGQFIYHVPATGYTDTCPGTCKYLSSAATGTGTGASWANAYTSLSTALSGTSRGQTLFIADGSYTGNVTYSPTASGTTLITITKATPTDHGAVADWSDTMGDGRATVTGYLHIHTTSYVTVNGNISGYTPSSYPFYTQGLIIEGGLELGNGAVAPTLSHHLSAIGVRSKGQSTVGQDILFKDGNVGAFDTCAAAEDEDASGTYTDPGSNGSSTRVTFDGMLIHDISDNPNGRGTLCTGEPGVGRHVDCMQILGGHFITVKNSKFWNCHTAGTTLIARPYLDGLNDLTLENNFFQDCVSPCATVNLGSSGDSITGTNLIRHNTIIGALSLAFSSGTGFSILGNILTVSGGTCGSHTWNYNLFYAGSTCGTNTRTGTPVLVSDPGVSSIGGSIPDYHLTGSDTAAKDRGNTANYPTTDIDGLARYVGSAPDLGADEYGN